MDIPLPQDPEPVSLIPTPDSVPLLKSQPSSLKSITMPPLPSAKPVDLLYSNIPMPDDAVKTKTSNPCQSEESNRYSPSILSEDDPPVNHTNTTNRFLVLGKEKAKKRLLAFSAAKQAGNSVLVFNVKKPPVKQNAAKGFEQSAEDDQKLNEVAVVKKKTPGKKIFKEDKARAVISAIEEIKREELLMRGAFRFGIQPKSSGPGDMTAPVPLLGQPLNINSDLSDRQKGAISDLIDNLLSNTDKEKRREERRNERSSRKKSQRRTRSRERRRSRSKPKERDTSKSKIKEHEKDVKLPQSWAEFRSSGIEFERFRRSRTELESKRNGNNKKQSVLCEKELCNPLDYPARLREPFKATGVRHVDREYSQDAIRYTKTKPSVAYCTNPGIESTRYRSRAEILIHANLISLSIMKSFLEATKNMCEDVEVIKETVSSRSWYSQSNYLNLSESDLNYAVDSLDVQFESKGAVEVDDRHNIIIEQTMTDVASVEQALFEPADSITENSNIVSSKWDSDCEIDNENRMESDTVKLGSIKTEKYEELEAVPNYLLDVPHNGEGVRAKEVVSPDQSGLLVTLPSSAGSDSNPNLKNEYEEFLKSVTAGDEAEELVYKEEKGSELENEKSESSSEDEETEAVAHREKTLQSSKKKSSATKSKTAKKSISRLSREKKKRRNQKDQKKKRKKRRRHCSTSSSSTSSTSDDSDEVVDKIVDQSKKSKKRKKAKARKRKQRSKKKNMKKRRKEYSSSEDESSSSSESSSESESDSSSSDSNSSSSSDNKRRRKKKSLKLSRKQKLSNIKKKQKKELLVASSGVLKTAKTGDKIVKTACSRDIEEMMNKGDSSEPKVDVDTTVPLSDSMSKIKLKTVKVQPDFHLEEGEADEEIFRKTDKKKRKHSKSVVSPIIKKQRRSPSTSPDSSSVSRPGPGSSDNTGIQYLHDNTPNTSNSKSPVGNSKGIGGAEDVSDKLAINGVININEENPVDQRRDIMWENDSPQVEGDEWENSLSWFKLHKQPVKSPLRFANLKEDNSTLSDDLNQEVAKRSLRELKYLREVIKSEVGIDSHSDIELEKDAVVSNTTIKCNIASEPLLTVNSNAFVSKLLEASLEDTIEPKSEVSDLYSPGQEYDEKSNCTEHSDTLLSDQHVGINDDMVKISPNCRESDMSMDSNTCENSIGLVPSMPSPDAVSVCFPYNTIPLPPQSVTQIVEPSVNTSTSKINPEEISVFEKKQKKTSPIVSKAKHIITVKLLPSAVRIQSQPVQSPEVKVEPVCMESKTLWKAIGSPTCPVEPVNISAIKPLILPKKVSRWSDVPVSETTPTIPIVLDTTSAINESFGVTLNPTLIFTDTCTKQECNTLEMKDVPPLTVNTNLIAVECMNSMTEVDKKCDEVIKTQHVQEKDDNKDIASKDGNMKRTSSRDKDILNVKKGSTLDRKDDKHRSNRSREERDSKRSDRDDKWGYNRDEKWGYNRDDNGRRKNYDRVKRSPSDRRREKSPSGDKRRERSPGGVKRKERSPSGDKRKEKSPVDKQGDGSSIERCNERSPLIEKRRERSPFDKRKEGSQCGDWRNEKSPNVDKRRGRSPADRRKERSPRRRRSPSDKGRDVRRRSPNRSRIESRDNFSQHDRRSGQRDYYKAKSHESSNRHQHSPLDNIPLPLIQSHVKDDCMSMDMEFSSPLSSPLVGLKRSLADSTTRSDEELKSADSNQMLLSAVNSQRDQVMANIVDAEIDTNVSSPFSPKRLSLDERLERELGVDLGSPSPPKNSPPGPPALTPIPRDPNYPYWPYKINFSSSVESGGVKRPGLLPTPVSEKYLGAQSSQLISGTLHPNNYYIQSQGPNYIATVNGPHMQAMISETNYLPRMPLAQTYPGAPTKPLQPISIPDSNFVVPSLSRPPLPVPRPGGRESPSNALIANSLPRIFHVHNSINRITPVSLISPTPLLASPQEFVCQPGIVTVPESDIHMVRNFYPDVPIFNEFGREVLKEPQIQYTPHVTPELTTPPRGVCMKPKSPVLLSDADKTMIKKKAARDLLKREKDLRRKEIEKERILKMKKIAKYKETLQQEGDTLRRSVTLNLEEIRLTGTLSPTQHTPVLNSRLRIPAVNLKPLTNVPATKGILVSIGFREKSSSGMETRKSVMFADGVRPGDGTSPSAGEDPLSPPHYIAKEKRLHKKKKKIKVHVIRQSDAEKGAANIDTGNSDTDGGDDVNNDSLPPPPPPPGSPPPYLKPYAFPGPQPGKMFPRVEMVSTISTQESVCEPPDSGEPSWVNVISSPVPMEELVDTYISAQKAMKLTAYHQAMMSIKHQQAPGSWLSSLQSPCHESINVSQPPMFDQYLNSVGPNVALQSMFNGPKGSYTFDRSPTVPSGVPPNNANYGLHYGFPPPPLPQSPQLRNPPPAAPIKTKSYRLPP